MTEERSCNNCGIDLICQECDMGNSNWQPIAQEKSIGKKVIFESREEDCYKFCEKVKLGMNHEAILWNVNEIEKHGYIRKSALEEAEEMYNEHFNSHLARGYDLDQVNEALGRANNLIKKLYLAIQELKSEIEVLG